MTNEHKLGGLKHSNVSSQSSEARSPNPRCEPRCTPPEGSREESFLPIPASGGFQVFLGLQLHH